MCGSVVNVDHSMLKLFSNDSLKVLWFSIHIEVLIDKKIIFCHLSGLVAWTLPKFKWTLRSFHVMHFVNLDVILYLFHKFGKFTFFVISWSNWVLLVMLTLASSAT